MRNLYTKTPVIHVTDYSSPLGSIFPESAERKKKKTCREEDNTAVVKMI